MARVLPAVLILLLVPGAAFAAPKDDVAGATVNVYCTYKSGKKLYSSTGSGFFVDAKGVIMTNAHVAVPFLLTDKKGKTASKCSIRTGSPAKDAYTARVLYISPDWITDNLPELKKGRPRGTGEGDFALLQVTGAKKGALPASFPTLPIATSGNVLEGDELVVAGYPVGDRGYKEVRSKLSLEAATPTLQSVRYYVRPHADLIVVSPSALSASGVSGGPVTTKDGRAIGIATAVESTEDIEERSLRAITLSYVDRVLAVKTGKPLSLLLASDRNALASSTASSLSKDLLSDLRAALMKRK